MPGTRWVLLDDTDSAIKYKGGWYLENEAFVDKGNTGATFRRSQHALTGDNGTLSFHFTGTRIRLLGSSVIRNASGVADPRWECFVDGVSINSETPFDTHQNNWPLCLAPTLEDGEHTLTLNASSSGVGTFYFDQIKYLPSAKRGPQPLNATVIIEQTDPAISYNPPDAWKDVNESARSTSTIGASMSVNFTGTSLAWVGWLLDGSFGDSGGSFSVDGGHNRSFILMAPSTPGSHFFQRIFETGRLLPGPHHLTVTYQGPNTTPLALDHLLIEDGDILIPDASQNLIPTGPASPTSNRFEGPANAPPPIGAILGGVLGGLALICLFVVALIFIRRRMRMDLPPIPVPSFHHGRPRPRNIRQSFSKAMVRKTSTGSQSTRTSNSSDHAPTVNLAPTYPTTSLEGEIIIVLTPPPTTRLTPLRRHMVIPNTIPE